MTDTNKLEKWAFPFKTASASGAEVSDPQLYYDALAKAKNGFYPMGSNGLWHGGVHFDAGTGALLDQSSVRCIADGEVIAYRIDERYPTSQYGEGPTAMHLPFSTGFVLVKHRLELPALPAAAPVATPATAAPAAEALTFYSLYMHLLDWAGYCAPGAPTPAEFLAPTRHTVSTRPTDPQLGLRVRKEASGGSTEVLALLPKGCKVTLGIADPLKPDWKQLLSVDEGAAIPPLAGGVIGWVFTPELTGNTVADLAKDSQPELTLSHQGLNVRKEGKLTGAIIGVLPQGAKLKIGPKEANGYCKLLEVLDYKGVPALPNGADGKPQGYVYHADLDASRTPPLFNTVTLLPTPQPIKAGELIGHLGQYQNHDDATPKSLLHLEVFSCDDVPAFIAKSRALAASLPDSAKTLLQVQPGTKLVTHAASMCAATPPTVSDPGSTIGVTRSIPLAVLNSLPAERKIQTSTPMAGGAPIVTQWWRLDNAFADEHGNLISGWLADVIPTRHSPWEWEGFDFISETVCAADQFACHLDAQRLLSEAELPDYQAQISTADNGPIKTRLYDIIDGADGTARDEKLSVNEIRAALGKPWHAQSISQLISHYESEWFWRDAKWDALDKLMEHTPTTPNTDWVAEKARIKTLAWWDKVEGQHGIKPGGMAWHFQMTGLTGNFCALENEDSIKWLKVPRGQLTFDVEGNDIDDPTHTLYIYFSRVVHWPGGVSGVTIGRGYDLGQRPNPETDLSSAGLSEPLLSWLVAAKGLKGQAAKNYLNSASAEIRKTKITRKQQHDLFIPIYEFMKSEVIRISGKQENINEFGELNWTATDSKIQDMAIDLIYRGDYTASTRVKVQEHISNNNLEKLREAMSNQSNWLNVPLDRFNRRVEYLR